MTFKQLKEQKPSTPTATAQITTPAPANADSDLMKLNRTSLRCKTKTMNSDTRVMLQDFLSVEYSLKKHYQSMRF